MSDCKIFKVRHYDLHEKDATVVKSDTSDLNKLNFNSKVLSLMELWIKSSSNFNECPFRGKPISSKTNCRSICKVIFPGLIKEISNDGHSNTCPCKEYRPVDVQAVVEEVVAIHKNRSSSLRVKLFFNSALKRSYDSWF